MQLPHQTSGTSLYAQFWVYLLVKRMRDFMNSSCGGLLIVISIQTLEESWLAATRLARRE